MNNDYMVNLNEFIISVLFNALTNHLLAFNMYDIHSNGQNT
jgi:hypothetical protein